MTEAHVRGSEPVYEGYLLNNRSVRDGQRLRFVKEARGPPVSHTWPGPLCCARRLTQNRKHGFSPALDLLKNKEDSQELSLVYSFFADEGRFFARGLLICFGAFLFRCPFVWELMKRESYWFMFDVLFFLWIPLCLAPAARMHPFFFRLIFIWFFVRIRIYRKYYI